MQRIIFSSCLSCYFFCSLGEKGKGYCEMYELIYDAECEIYKVKEGQIWYKCPLKEEGITFRAMPLNSYVVNT